MKQLVYAHKLPFYGGLFVWQQDSHRLVCFKMIPGKRLGNHPWNYERGPQKIDLQVGYERTFWRPNYIRVWFFGKCWAWQKS